MKFKENEKNPTNYKVKQLNIFIAVCDSQKCFFFYFLYEPCWVNSTKRANALSQLCCGPMTFPPSKCSTSFCLSSNNDQINELTFNFDSAELKESRGIKQVRQTGLQLV